MSTYTADSPPPCPACGTMLTEGSDATDCMDDGTLLTYRCSACHWEDGGGYDYKHLTVATAPWSRDLWAEVERLTAERDSAAAHARHLQEALDNTFKDRDADIAEVDRLRSAAAERAEAERDAAAAKERAAVVAWLREVSWWSTTDAHAASIERGDHLEVPRA